MTVRRASSIGARAPHTGGADQTPCNSSFPHRRRRCQSVHGGCGHTRESERSWSCSRRSAKKVVAMRLCGAPPAAGPMKIIRTYPTARPIRGRGLCRTSRPPKGTQGALTQFVPRTMVVARRRHAGRLTAHAQPGSYALPLFHIAIRRSSCFRAIACRALPGDIPRASRSW
jgi:hypothetical protein